MSGLCYSLGFVCKAAVNTIIMQCVQFFFSPSFTVTALFFFKAKETNCLCVLLFLFFTLHIQYICNVAYPCKIMMYHSYLPWL